MNRIYKLVWSKTRNMYVVVCEFAKSHTKTSKKNVFNKTIVAWVLACVLSGISCTSSYAMDILNATLPKYRPSGTNASSSENWCSINGYKMIGNAILNTALNEALTNYYRDKFNDNTVEISVNSIGLGKDGKIAFFGRFYAQNANTYTGMSMGGQARKDIVIDYDEIQSFGITDGLFHNFNSDGYLVNYSAVNEGIEAVAQGNNSVAIGTNAVTNGNASDSVALGSNSIADVSNVISVGNDTLKRRIVNVADGINDNDVVTVGQLNNLSSQVLDLNNVVVKINDEAVHYVGINSSDDLNRKGDGALGINSIAIGYNAFAPILDSSNEQGLPYSDNIAIGSNAYAQGSAVAIGSNSYATFDSISIGNKAKASGNGVALGENAISGGDISIGYNSSSSNPYSISIGQGSRTNSYASSAIGYQANVDRQPTTNGAINSVALGSYSTVDVPNAISVGHKIGDHYYVSNYPLNGSTQQHYTDELKRRIINVADGINDDDVATVGQLNVANNLVSNLTDTVNGGTFVKYDDNDLSSSEFHKIISLDENMVGDGVQITNVARGMVSASSSDAINGSQLYETNQFINHVLSDSVVMDDGNYVKSLNTVAKNLMALDNAISNNDNKILSALAYDSDDHSTITLDGIRGTKLTGLKPGLINQYSQDAVIGHQLYQTNENIKGFANDIKTNSENISHLVTAVTNSLNSVSSISSAKADTNLANINETGRDVIATVATGVVEEYLRNNNNSSTTGNLTISTPRTVGLKSTPLASSANDEVVVTNNDDLTGNGDNTINPATQDALDTKVNVSDFNDSMDLKADKNSVYSKDETDTLLGNKADKANTLKGYGIEDAYTKEDTDTLLNKKADKTALDEVKAITESNQKALAELTNVNELIEETETIKKRIDDMEIIVGSDAVLMTTNNSDMITASTDSIEIGSDVKYDDLNSISIAKSDGSGRVLRGVITDPEDNNSVANVGYVNVIGEGIIAGVNSKFAKVDDKINKVGAGATAMASLTPANYDGDEKWTLSASVGNYRDATAGAIGLFYRPSDKVMVNVRGTIGNEENMVGGGVAVALDKGSAPGVTKAQMVKTINAQAEEIQSIKAEREADKQHIAQQDKEIAELKAIVQKLVKANSSSR